MSSRRTAARPAILARLRSSKPRFIVLTAAAGFGKTTIADAYVLGGPSAKAVTVDCGDGDAASLIQTLRDALTPRARTRNAPDGDPLATLLDAWQGRGGAETIVFDRAETLVGRPAVRDVVDKLLAFAHPARHVVVCTRRPLPFRQAAFALPHETALVGADDLRLDVAAIGAILDGAGAAGHAAAVAALTDGWPVAVRFARSCAENGTLATVLADPASDAATAFHHYVEREVIAPLDAPSRDVALACASRPLVPADLTTLLGAPAAETGITTLAESGLLVRTATGAWSLTPLVAATLRALDGARVVAFLERLAAHHAGSEPLRAAPLLAAAGDVSAAERAYRHAGVTVVDRVDFESSLQVATFDRGTLLDNLALFNAATQADYYTVDVDDWILQAREALRRADPEVPGHTRAVAVLHLVLRFAQAGRVDEGHALLRAERARIATPDLETTRRFALLAAILDAAADRSVDLDALRATLDRDLADGYIRGLFARRVSSLVYAAHGRTADALREYDVAYARASSYGRVPYALEIAMLACFEAWRAGDDGAAQRWFQRVDGAHDHRASAGTQLFRAAFRGAASASDAGGETAVTRAHAALIAASFEDDAAAALPWLERALDAARETNRPLTLVLAHVALARVDRERADTHLAAATGAAARCASPALGDAVAALCDGRAGGMLAAFAERYDRVRIPAGAELDLRVLDGALRWNGVAAAIDERPFAAIVVLALARGPLAQDDLIEHLWPGRGPAEMANALRVHLSAARKALCKDAIRYERGRYRLACAYRLDLEVFEAAVAGIDRRGTSRELDRRTLREVADALAGRTALAPDLEASLGLRQRIATLHARVLDLLADDALAGARYDEALRYAHAAHSLDPYDERTAELIVTAYLRDGRRAAAVRAFRAYAELIERDLGIRPSAALLELINASSDTRSTSERTRSA